MPSLGEITNLILALVAAFGAWQAWEAKRSSKKNAAIIKDVATKVDGMLVKRDATNFAAGEVTGRKAGDDASDQRAEGRREQREIQKDRDATAAALNPHPNGAPVPVADDRTAKAAESTASATERIADAAETSSLSKKV